MATEEYYLGVRPGDIADLHDGKEPKPLHQLWLEGKLTSPGAAQQGYWAHREYMERVEGTAGEEIPSRDREYMRAHSQ